MAYHNQNLKRDASGIPVPQVFNPDTNDFEVLEGSANSFPVVVTGNRMEFYGKSSDNKPNNAEVPVGAVFFEIDTTAVFMNDGLDWVEI